MPQSSKEKIEQLNRQINELTSLYRDAMSLYKISENEFWVWYSLIMFEGDLTQQDICSAWFLPKQTVNTIIRRMVRMGYVTLTFLPRARNRKLIHLTEAGRKYGETIVLPFSKIDCHAFEKLCPEDQHSFVDILGKYIANLRQANLDFYPGVVQPGTKGI